MTFLKNFFQINIYKKGVTWVNTICKILDKHKREIWRKRALIKSRIGWADKPRNYSWNLNKIK